MTAHNHSTIVPGCFRCDLSSDELDPRFDVNPTVAAIKKMPIGQVRTEILRRKDQP